MKKEVRNNLNNSSKNQSMILLQTSKGLVKISHYNNVMIVETKNKDLFKRGRRIKLTDTIEVTTETISLKLKKGIIGYLNSGRVYFQVELGFLGLGKEYLQDKTNYYIANLC